VCFGKIKLQYIFNTNCTYTKGPVKKLPKKEGILIFIFGKTKNEIRKIYSRILPFKIYGQVKSRASVYQRLSVEIKGVDG
jgi:hypothetical protein